MLKVSWRPAIRASALFSLASDKYGSHKNSANLAPHPSSRHRSRGEAREEASPVVGPLLPALLRLDDLAADRPVW